MKAVRAVANMLLRDALAYVDLASPAQVGAAYSIVRRVCGPIGLPLPVKLDPDLIKSILCIIGSGIVNTPYGRPIDLDLPLFVTLSVGTYCPFTCKNCYSA